MWCSTAPAGACKGGVGMLLSEDSCLQRFSVTASKNCVFLDSWPAGYWSAERWFRDTFSLSAFCSWGKSFAQRRSDLDNSLSGSNCSQPSRRYSCLLITVLLSPRGCVLVLPLCCNAVHKMLMPEAALASFIYLDIPLHLQCHLTNWKIGVTRTPSMRLGSFCVNVY